MSSKKTAEKPKKKTSPKIKEEKKEKKLKTEDKFSAKKIEQYIDKNYHKKPARKMLWLGVFIIMFTLLVSWFFMLKMQIKYLTKKNKEENTTLKIQEKWNEIFEEDKNKEIQNLVKKQIQEIGQTLNLNENSELSTSTITDTTTSTTSTILTDEINKQTTSTTD